LKDSNINNVAKKKPKLDSASGNSNTNNPQQQQPSHLTSATAGLLKALKQDHWGIGTRATESHWCCTPKLYIFHTQDQMR